MPVDRVHIVRDRSAAPAGALILCLAALLLAVLPALGGEDRPAAPTGVYEYVYPYNTVDLVENHYIELYLKNGRPAGRYFGTSDDFDEAREGYLPGFFGADMTDLRVTATTVDFTVDIDDADLVSEPVTPFQRTPRAAPWNVGLRHHKRQYRGRLADGDLVISTDGFDPRVFRKIADRAP